MTRFRLILIAFIVLILISFTSIVFFYTDWLWFGEVGFRSVFVKMIEAKAITGLVFGTSFWIFLTANVLVARRLAPKLYYLTPRVSLQSIIQQVKPYVDRFFAPIFWGGSLLIALLTGLGMSGEWDTWLRYLNQANSPVRDPIFHRSISFYFFSLPAMESLQTFILFTVIITALITTAIHFFDGGIVPGLGKQTFAPHVKAHLSWLAALFMFDLAALWSLDIYNLLYSPTGHVVFGASYTDVNATMPALQFMVVISVISALIFLANIFIRGWRLPIAALSLAVAAWLLAVNIYPALVQSYSVSPNEIVREKPYIKLNIANTRSAYNLNKITEKPFPALNNLNIDKLAANQATIDNVRLWDWRPLQRTYSQIQEIRLYYTFKDVDLDRYIIDDHYRQVTISARELSIDQLPATAKTWINEHLVFTHGYGAVMSPVNEVSAEGLPKLLIKNIPPVSTTNVKLTKPQIYFGEDTGNYVITNTKTAEFDYPKGQKNQYTTYTGSGGVPVSSLLTKAAFSYRFSSLQLLLSDAITNRSRVLFNRNVIDRVQAIAPFLQYDSDPYLVIIKGKLYWIIDAYTTSDRYPYSKPYDGGNNYIRNSVKVVVDAYNGATKFYLIDPNDPVAATYRTIFPDLFTSFTKLPADFRKHLRYPETLFNIQANMYTAFHMRDPQVFYNKEDMWDIPQELSDSSGRQTMQPYYAIMKLPGETKEEFLLLLPFTPTNKANMIALMAARNDFPHYGELSVFDFPKDRLIFGPSQIESRIQQEPSISQQLTLWNQSGSRVIYGNLLVIPIEQSIIYVEPLYLQSEQSDLPELKRVIVSYNDQIAMEPTLEDALFKIFTGAPAAPAAGNQPSGKAVSPTVTDLISQANNHFSKAQDAAKNGDWSTYGDELKKLGDVLDQLRVTK